MNERLVTHSFALGPEVPIARVPAPGSPRPTWRPGPARDFLIGVAAGPATRQIVALDAGRGGCERPPVAAGAVSGVPSGPIALADSTDAKLRGRTKLESEPGHAYVSAAQN